MNTPSRWTQSIELHLEHFDSSHTQIQFPFISDNVLGNGQMAEVKGASFCWFVNPGRHKPFLNQLVTIQEQLLKVLSKENVILVPTSSLHMTLQGCGYHLKEVPTKEQLQTLRNQLNNPSWKPVEAVFEGPYWDVEFGFVMALKNDLEMTSMRKETARKWGFKYKERPFHVTLAYPAFGTLSKGAWQDWQQRFENIPPIELEPVWMDCFEFIQYRDVAFINATRPGIALRL